MQIRFILDIQEDTWNSRPHDKLVVTICPDEVHIRVTEALDDAIERVITIDREEFAKLLSFVNNPQ